MKKKFLHFLIIAAFFIMLFLSSATKEGALNGLNLWFFTIVPTLLPFMFISSIIVETGSYRIITDLLGYIMKPVFHLPKAAAYPFLIGMLCGFPMGSKITADMVKANKLSVQNGNVLLTFCNNISPPFIISFVTFHVLGISGIEGRIVIFIMLISPIVTGFITSRIISLMTSACTYSVSDSRTLQNITAHNDDYSPSHGFSIDKCIISSMQNVVKLGGYIIIFSIICSLTQYILHNEYIYATVSGLLEITSGLNAFVSIPLSLKKIYTVCILSSFGGICTIAQTMCMTNGSHLSIRLYIVGKLLNCLVTFILLAVII